LPRESGSPGHGPSGQPGDDKQESQRAFFGRRKGHALKPRQAARFDTLLPTVGLDLAQPAPAELEALFPRGMDEVRLEIGFGGAEHLIAQAEANPNVGYVGTDAFLNGVAKALAAIDERKRDNIRLFHGDASELIDWLPPASLARIDLLYPDPWPKRRHWKRRFVQDGSLGRLARILIPGGEFRFATDIASYAEHTLMRVLRSPDFIWTAERADDWRKPWPGFVRTRYEAKAIREGRTPAYFIFRTR
jgi:tRNA (guanine-N7-)-methyltransferase